MLSDSQVPSNHPKTQKKIQQTLEIFRREAGEASMQRAWLELMAAFSLKKQTGCSIEAGLVTLAQDLDINSLLLQPDYKHLLTFLTQFFDQLDPDVFDADLVDAEEILQSSQASRGTADFYIYPFHFNLFPVSLVPGPPYDPVLFLEWGSSTLVPHVWTLLRVSCKQVVSLDHQLETAENLKLLTFLTIRDGSLLRDSFRSYADWTPDGSNWRAVIDENLGPDQFGTILINFFSPFYNNPRLWTHLDQDLPLFLAQRLTPQGRAVLLGPANILDGMGFSKLRTALRSQLHLEAVVDVSSASSFIGIHLTPVFILLRRPQQAITQRVTVLGPASPNLLIDEENPLKGLTPVLDERQQSSSEKYFERPTVEIGERWDPKYYCPARLRLQDSLINSAQATWLGSITQFIGRGTSPLALKPYINTKLAGVTHAGRQETIVYLKSGDLIRLRREENNPHDPNAVHVERRSGTSLGYLPAELAVDIAEALSELGGTYEATVVKLQGGTTDAPNRGVTIQFAPPQYAKLGESVTVIRPSDIINNRLTGSTEVAWLLNENKDKVTRLQGGDILLPLRGFGKACVVPREFERAVCHQELAIIRPKEEIDPLYLLSFILSAEFQEQLQFVARGGTVPRIDLTSLEELLVIVPTLDVQRRVALVFAESQGELGPGFKDNIERWLDLGQSEKTIERQWIPSSLLSNLFSDWDRIQGLDDWLRLKHSYVTELRNSIAHNRFSFNEPSVDAAVMALGNFSRTVDHIWRNRDVAAESRSQIEHELTEFQVTSQQVQNQFLQRRFSSLASMLQELLQVRVIPLPVQLEVEQTTLPIGVPAFLRLTVTNPGKEPLLYFKIKPALSPGELLDLPAWQIDQLSPGETYAFEARLRLDRLGSAELECVVSYTAEDNSVVERAVQLTLEAVPAEQIPFESIQPNPYITGGAVDTPTMFFGRQDVLDFLSANLIGTHQSNVIILQGNRRTGKSSILKQTVNGNIFSPHFPVYIDCQGLGKLTDQRFFYKIAREIWKALRKQADIDMPALIQRQQISEDDAFYDFKEILNEWSELIPGRRIILLIDEFEVIDLAIQRGELSATVLENLRHLFQHRHDLAIVLTGSYRLTRFRQDYWSILFGLGLKREVGFLDELAARQLIRQPLADIVTFSAEAVDRIIELTACQPYFIQMICHNIVNVLNTYRTTYVTQSFVEEAAQETLVSADGHMRFIFESVESPAWQAILVYLASSLGNSDALPLFQLQQFVESNQMPISKLEMERTLREMADRDIIQMDGSPDQRRYGFKIDLIRQWIRRNYDLQSAISLAQNAPYIREE